MTERSPQRSSSSAGRYGDGPGWRDAAEKALDAMHERAQRAEAERDRYRETLKLAHGCLLEVRRDFDAPINNVIAEVRAALKGDQA